MEPAGQMTAVDSIHLPPPAGRHSTVMFAVFGISGYHIQYSYQGSVRPRTMRGSQRTYPPPLRVITPVSR